MALADPQALTIGSALSLPRVSQGVLSGEFSTADDLVHLLVANQRAKRWRTTVRVNHRKVAPNPFDTSVNAEYSMATYLVIDRPFVGYTVAEAKQVIDGLSGWLTATSGSNVTKILGGES